MCTAVIAVMGMTMGVVMIVGMFVNMVVFVFMRNAHRMHFFMGHGMLMVMSAVLRANGVIMVKVHTKQLLFRQHHIVRQGRLSGGFCFLSKV